MAESGRASGPPTLRRGSRIPAAGDPLPKLAALKLCAACDQVSLVRSTAASSPRALRCKQRLAGKICDSRSVEVLSVAEFNMRRALDKAAAEGRIGDLEARVERLEASVTRLLHAG